MPSFAQPVKRAKSRLQRPIAVQRKPDWRPTASTITTKARSRLKKHFVKPHFTAKSLRVFRKGLPRFFPSILGIREVLHTLLLQRLPFLSILGLGLIASVVSGIFFTKVPPQIVADLPLYHSYGPAMLLILITCASLAAFLLAHIRRGALVGLCITSFVLLRVQDFTLETIQIGAIIIFFFVIELILSVIEKYMFSRKASPQHRHHKV